MSRGELFMGKIIKRIATAILLLVCLMFIIRCCMAADKSKFSDLYATDALKSAWTDGESEILTVKVHAEMAQDGYFSAYGFYYNPESGEVQFAVRWNRSVYTYTDMEPGHEFSFHLLNETTGAVYPAFAVAEDSMTLYQYRKMLAEGVSVGEDEQLTVVMELRDGFESKQVLKYAEQVWKPYKVKKSFLKEVQ